MTKNNGEWKEGDTIVVRVDFEKGTVSWMLNGTATTTVNNKYLMDKSIKWVPFLFIYGKKSVVAISE